MFHLYQSYYTLLTLAVIDQIEDCLDILVTLALKDELPRRTLMDLKSQWSEFTIATSPENGFFNRERSFTNLPVSSHKKDTQRSPFAVVWST